MTALESLLRLILSGQIAQDSRIFQLQDAATTICTSASSSDDSNRIESNRIESNRLYQLPTISTNTDCVKEKLGVLPFRWLDYFIFSLFFEMLSVRRYQTRSGPSFFLTTVAVFLVVPIIVAVITMTTNGVDSLAAGTGSTGGSAGANSNAAASPDPNAVDGMSNPNDEVHLLPPPSNDNDPSIPTIKLGETIRFEQYGPIILNSDGTTRRMYVFLCLRGRGDNDDGH